MLLTRPKLSLLQLILLFTAVPLSIGYWQLVIYAKFELRHSNPQAAIYFVPFNSVAFFLYKLVDWRTFGGNSVAAITYLKFFLPIVSIWLWISIGIMVWTPHMSQAKIESPFKYRFCLRFACDIAGFFAFYVLLYGFVASCDALQVIPPIFLDTLLFPCGGIATRAQSPSNSLFFVANALIWSTVCAPVAHLVRGGLASRLPPQYRRASLSTTWQQRVAHL